jgi:hypothetical protein
VRRTVTSYQFGCGCADRAALLLRFTFRKLAQYFHRSTDQLGPQDIREYIAHLCSQVVDVPARIAANSLVPTTSPLLPAYSPTSQAA